MPIYEYRCEACHQTSEFTIGVCRQPNEIRCPHCGSMDMTRRLSAGAIHVKSDSGCSHPGSCCQSDSHSHPHCTSPHCGCH
ncbi:MAG: zinc ribbon domain-containing protein [Candidatus Delongbacteria bacterium]|nr:zinc ribbon domain-containing protein [Candidatus Delongbacteria bacterium]